MKKLVLILLLSIIAFTIKAQTPQAFKYQAVVRDNSGNMLSDQAVGFRISIRTGTPAGTVIYQETHTALTNQFGLADINIGEGLPLSGAFHTIDWSAGSKYLQIELDPTGGTSYTLTGTSQILSVPYALAAASSGSVDLPYSDTIWESGTYSDQVIGLGFVTTGNWSNAIRGFNNYGNTEGILGNHSYGVRGSNSIMDTWGGLAGNHGVTGHCLKPYSSNSFAGYFEGNVRITDTLEIGPSYLYAENGHLRVNGDISIYNQIWSLSDYGIHFVTNDAIIRMKIADNGNIGIGTTGPANKMDVRGDRIKLTEDATGDWIAMATDGGLVDLQFGGNSLVITSPNAGEHVLVNPASGNNLGIGTWVPLEKLHVNGKIYVSSMDATSAGNPVRWYNNRLYYQSSSKKYKNDIQPLKEDFKKILDAESRSFTDKASGEEHIGFIAEEFEEIGLERLVIEHEGQPDGIRYELVSLYLLEVIKEHEKEMESMRQRIRELELK